MRTQSELADPMGVFGPCLVITALIATTPVLQKPERTAPLVLFDRAVAEYVGIHHRLAGSVEPIEEGASELFVAPSALRQRIQKARAAVPEGALFTPAVAATFRSLIAAASRGDFTSLLKDAQDEPDELGRAIINHQWPSTALTTMRPDVLAVLPPLPSELEYRFVHRDLVIWDVDADLIVDVLRDAIPLRQERRSVRD